MQTRLLILLPLLALFQAPLPASEEVLASSSLAFPSVHEGSSARAIAMGSTYVGVAQGSAALIWNPAGLGGLSAPEAALHHTSAILGAIQETAVLGLPLGRGNGLGLSLSYEDAGAFDGRDSLGNVSGAYTARGYGAGIGWGMAGPAGFSLGLAAKVSHLDLAGSALNAFAGDLGALWSVSPLFSLGVAYANLGPQAGGSALAQGFRAGVSSLLFKGEEQELLLALSGESMTFGQNSLHLGAEHVLHHFISLRAGYSFNLPNPAEASLVGWTFGAGLLYHQLAIDYAFVPLADLGNMQRLSLTYSFAHEAAAAAPAPASTPTPTPSAAPAAKPAAQLRQPPAEVETVLILTDGDFKRVVAGGEPELISAAAIGRLDRAITDMEKAPAGAYLRVIGTTLIAGPDWEMREIGNRRANLVRGQLVKTRPPSGIVNVVTTGARTGSLQGVFQVVIR